MKFLILYLLALSLIVTSAKPFAENSKPWLPPPFFPLDETNHRHVVAKRSYLLKGLIKRAAAASEFKNPWECIGCSPPFHYEYDEVFERKRQ